MHSFEAVYARMLFAAGVRTQTELANMLGMKQSGIPAARKRKSIPAEWCMRLYDACGVNFDWQRYGTGPVYDAAKLKEIERFRRGEWSSEVPAGGSSFLREPDTPFYGFAEEAKSVHSTLQMPDGSFPEAMRQVFPAEFLTENSKIFRLLDASMEPVLNKGAMVAVRQGAPVSDGDIVAIFEGRELVFRRAFRKEGGWTVRAEASLAENAFSDEDWLIYYYGKAVWAFQPL